MPSVVIVAGESSGDVNGAFLAEAIRELAPDVRLIGCGGERMRAAGMEMAVEFPRGGAIGIIESLRLTPGLFGKFRSVKSLLCETRPEVFVPIDFGAFNVRVGNYARELGIRTAYYYPPSSWRRKLKSTKWICECCDKVITPFPWSAKLLQDAGLDAQFLGHPLLDVVKPKLSRTEFLRGLGLAEGVRLIGLLPGSRLHEVRNILPELIKAARLIGDAHPEYRFVVAATGSTAKWADGLAAGAGIMIAEGAAYDVMAHSDLIVTASGTATLEATILGTPMIIVYRGGRLMKLEYMLRSRLLESYIGMPNIIAGKLICPELLDTEASGDKIASIALEILESDQKRDSMKMELAKARAVLGESGGTHRAAKAILEFGGLI